MANHVGALDAPRTLRDPTRSLRALGTLWRFCRAKPLGAIGGLLVVLMIGMAVFANWIAPYSYDETIRGARMKAPGAQFWMGTDNLGRDIFSRVVYGARVSVTVGFGAVLLGNFLATVIGITSGYFGGKYDICVQRVVDAWQSFPFLVVILSIMAVLGPGMLNVILALGVLGAAAASRVIRGATIPPPSSSSPPSGSAGPSSRSRPCPFSASGFPRPTRRGGRCSPAPGAPTCTPPPGWRSGPGPRSRSPSSASTCWVTPCVTSSTLACAARAAAGSGDAGWR